jgi:hypothetical protein
MNNEYWMGFSRTAIAVAVAVVAAAPALAQNTTASVGGRVVGADGKPVAGASVTIVHVESGSTNNLTTDADGRYAARGLRAGGPYTITVSQGGLVDKKEGVFLALAETLSLDARLAAAATTIVVTGRSASDKFNRTSMGAGTSLSNAQINALPSIQRNLQDYARTDARVAQTDKDRGEISALGQNSRYNSITIDGVNTNDPFGLESNNLPTIKQPISMDAIQSVQVNVSNYDVTQKGYTGANINAVTKGGTNEFKGSLYYVFRDDQLVGDRYNRTSNSYTPVAPFKDTTRGFTLGGPIIKDKLFFFGNYEELSSSRATPIFGPLGSGQTNVGITPEQIAAAQQVARDVYGFDAGVGNVPSGAELTVKDTLLRLDWNISDAHRASLRYSKTEQSEPIYAGFSATTLSLDTYWYTEVKTNESMVAQWFADWTSNLSTETKISQRKYNSDPVTKSDLPQVALVFTDPPPAGTSGSTRTLRFGNEQFRHFNRIETTTTDAYLGATWSLADHELKFGADYQTNDIFNAFVNNSKGVYEFRGSDPVALFAAGTPTTYALRVPLPGRTLADGAADWTLNNLGLFLQDTWKVNQQLTLMGGVRLDNTIIDDKPIANPAFKAAFGYDNDVTMDGESLLQPRVGFNLNLTPEGGRRLQVRGGVGLFEGASSNVWITNPFQNTGVANASFDCGTANNPCPASVVFTPDTRNQPQITGVIPAAQVDLIAPGTSQPSVWKMSLAVDAELPWFGLVAGAEWVHTEVQSGLHYRNLNLGAPTATGPDGRPLFYNDAGRSAAGWNGSDAPLSAVRNRAQRNTAFGDVLLVESTGKGKGDALSLSLGGTAARSLNWNVAYTYTKATEVNPLTSSTAISNWNGRATFDPNEEVAGRSAYEVRDRIISRVEWSKAFFGNYKTTVGAFYEGRRGKPFSWTYRNDLNGDNIAGNDLMYIPSAPGSGEVVFFGATPEAQQANEARFWSIVNAYPDLAGAKGRVVSRNSGYAPWVNTIDLRLSQEIPGFLPKHKGVISFDILNFGNLLNKEWGRIDEVGFNGGTIGGVNSRGGNARSFVNYAGLSPDGKYIYNTQSTVEDLTTKQFRGESQWAVQVTLRYEF